MTPSAPRSRPTACLVTVLLLLLGTPAGSGRAEPEAPLWTRCYDAIPWLHSADIPNTERTFKDLVMRGALAEHSRRWIRAEIEKAPSIESCLETARKEKKLLLWYVPVVEGQHMVLPHLVDRYMMVGPWSHPDVVELVRRRYVAIRLPSGGALAARFETAAPRFMEPGLLVFAPDGTEVHRMDRVSTFAPEYFLHLLVTLAERQRGRIGHSEGYLRAQTQTTARPDDGSSWLALAREAILEGAYGAAEDALARAGESGGDPARAAYLRAILARRLRQGEAALAALEEARAADPDAALATDVTVEQGLVHLRRGDLEEAVAALTKVVDGDALGTRRAEAAYHLGATHYLTGRDEEAVAAWLRAAALEPESPWAARADACAVRGSDGRQGESALTRSMRDARWADPETYELGRDTQWRRTPEDAPDIRRRAIDFLLAQQRSNGSWPGFRWGDPGDGTAHSTNVDVAIAALCCAALHAWRDTSPSRIDEALQRGEEHLLAGEIVERGEAVAWVYADAFRLSHFAQRLPDLAERRRRAVRKAMRGWVANLVRHQEENAGSFRHYAYKSTFVTAAVTTCLHAAQEARIRVPDRVFERAAGVLTAARGPNGLFGYLLDNPAVTRTKVGAAARQPLCLLALVRCGKAPPSELPGAVDLYLESYDRSTELARKANFHVPVLDHTAGYYFFHDFHAACEAARAAGDDAAGQRRALLEKLCALPEIDGAFIDCGFSYGKSYSTAMALLSMRALVGEDDGG